MARLPAAGKALAVVLAILLAAAATFAIFTYVQGIEERAFEDAELVEVFVAEEAIPAGTAAIDASEAGLIVRETTPSASVPEGAIGSLEQINGLVALERVLPGEIILRDRWGDTGEVVGARFDIPDGFEAVSVQVGLVPGVAGFVRSGDRISMIASLVAPIEDAEPAVDEAGEPIDGEPIEGENISRYVLQDVEVLDVGPFSAAEVEEPEEAGGSVLLTVALEPEDAERLVFAITNAELHFTRLPEGAEPPPTPGRSLTDLFE